MEKQSIPNETEIYAKESDSIQYSDPETQTSFSTTTDPSIENDYSLEEEEDSNRTYPGDNPFMNPYKEKLSSWNKTTNIQRLGILQRYYSAGKNMVLESLPIKQHDQKRMDKILELVTDYVDQEYFGGGHNRMDYYALQFALFILLFTKNKSYEIKEKTKNAFWKA